MKFMHIADLHLGKVIYQKDLLIYQEIVLNQALEQMKKDNINVLVIAGDIYDRQLPSIAAVNLLNDFLNKAINKYHYKVLIIKGNHDGGDRLNFGSELLNKQGLYIESILKKEITKIEIDGVNFYLLPFFKPYEVRSLFEVENINTYQEAMSYYLNQQVIDKSKPCVLITHHFVAGTSKVITSESEEILSVGGSEIIGIDTFDKFDYVALGHLHASQKIGKENIRYSGSILKYSFDEANQTKNFVEVEIDKKINIKSIPINLPVDLIKVRGYFEEVIANTPDKINFYSIELEDDNLIVQALSKLRQIYPNILQITYPNLYHISSNQATRAKDGFEKKTDLDIFKEFYQEVRNQKLNEEGIKIIQDLLEEDKK